MIHRKFVFLAVTLSIAFCAQCAYAASAPQYLYQLQNAQFSKLRDSNCKYYVVDPDDSELTASQLTTLKGQGKVILAYISIGEAETYRDYWQSSWKEGNPAFLEKENPDWGGNYKVKFWMPEWQTILLNFLRTHILQKGYSGLYLDIIDAYYYFENQRPSAKQDMVNFISRIRAETLAVIPGGKIFPQNAVELYENVGYRQLMDGFGVEDTWMDGDKMQPSQQTKYVLNILKQAKQDGKVVLAVDYPKKQNNICTFYQKCNAEGLICGAFDRDLTGKLQTCNA
ncbi:uncharacterized protein DR_0705-like [Paramacrobiotus metropolitanus]|uniref:uncharacterized protein DR_0705-like n=1 Tax=Paramacrobiotus metropolitanus TaxID=2943436 RepID=UPI0024462C26|nr:uncharacterized protein DR_0705-like [Paramacrobiotus metropolitanus]